MSEISCILKYFNLSAQDIEKLELFISLLKEYNEKVNLVSRQDINNLCIRHVLHSLSIAKYFNLDNKKIIDIGTGGGFPGIPLAIFFKNAQFLLIDSIEKKIKAVKFFVEKLNLKNVKAEKKHSKEVKEKFDIITARAVSSFPKFLKNTKHLFLENTKIIYLKGGDFSDEIQHFKNQITIYNLSEIFEEDFFATKKIIVFKPKK